MINYMQRLGFPTTSSIDYRKLAVELAEVIIKWELQRIKDETAGSEGDDENAGEVKVGASGAIKRTIPDDPYENRKKLATGETVPQQQPVAGTIHIEFITKTVVKAIDFS